MPNEQKPNSANENNSKGWVPDTPPLAANDDAEFNQHTDD